MLKTILLNETLTRGLCHTWITRSVSVPADVVPESRVKLGRWWYCKYCYKHVRPVKTYANIPELGGLLLDLVSCSECGAGLARLKDVEEEEGGK
jgi:hypothetical protein